MDRDELVERRGGELPRPEDVRAPFERDRARIIHSAAFRRLQAKSQVLGIGEGDFHRTRLTHSMETAQIGRGLTEVLGRQAPVEIRPWLPDKDLVEAICLAHDLGHPPFGHDGETALNYCLVRAWQEGEKVSRTVPSGLDGFEANGQTLRLVGLLELHTPGHGLNLCRRTLMGLLKYPVPFSRLARTCWPTGSGLDLTPWTPPKCYLDEEEELVRWILAPLHEEERAYLTEARPPTAEACGVSLRRGLDASLLTLADDIAYGTHDIEDGIVLGLIRGEDVEEFLAEVMRTRWAREQHLEQTVRDLLTPGRRKVGMGALVNTLVTHARVVWRQPGLHPLVGAEVQLADEAAALLRALKELAFQRMIAIPSVQTLRFRGQQMLLRLFEAFHADPRRLLPVPFRERWEEGVPLARVVADYISGMTDQYAAAMYQRLYIPGHGSSLNLLVHS